ncbi:MAG TPA: polysaccharide deacetylase family protein [Acidobacteriota bacterium]|nr:polysaccharide deacetylase family protein [Acidobacteriota bacterium]HOT01182.1 polysaccharide deacetylase family protein [Acidobacteriota bacterium]HQF86223.1 polysaccharide deacetylase family protein [Acidobacteriota bacterium]HQG90533.1 polysaccharide deacetylase family protein [Acidobacteriota bacterium]HQK86245.1 polysaccharide deacetylase family protein [Acidobacteriota bacterium]
MASDLPRIEDSKPAGGVRQSKTALFRPLVWGLGLLLVLTAMGALVAPPFPTSLRHQPVKPAGADGVVKPAPSLNTVPGAGPDTARFTPALALPGHLQQEWSAEGPYHFTRGSPDLPNISLTFDGDSTDCDLPAILQVLARHRITATFFLTGEFLERFPESVRAAVAGGHEIGSHLYRHVHLTTWEANRHHDTRSGITREYLHELLEKNEIAFRNVTNQPMVKLWRAPFGETNPTINAWAAELGYWHVTWTRSESRDQSMDSLDWVADRVEPRYLTAPQILERLLAFDGGVPGGANGAIILMHTGSQRREERGWTILDDLIVSMTRRGYHFVPVSRLITVGWAHARDRGKTDGSPVPP